MATSVVFPTVLTETAGNAGPTGVSAGPAPTSNPGGTEPGITTANNNNSNTGTGYYFPWGGVGPGIGVFIAVLGLILFVSMCCLPRSRYRYGRRNRYGWGNNYNNGGGYGNPPVGAPAPVYQPGGYAPYPPAYPPPAYMADGAPQPQREYGHELPNYRGSTGAPK